VRDLRLAIAECAESIFFELDCDCFDLVGGEVDVEAASLGSDSLQGIAQEIDFGGGMNGARERQRQTFGEGAGGFEEADENRAVGRGLDGGDPSSFLRVFVPSW